MSSAFCLACGGALPEVLQRLSALRCHDCVQLDTPLHVEHARRARALRLGRRAAASVPVTFTGADAA